MSEGLRALGYLVAVFLWWIIIPLGIAKDLYDDRNYFGLFLFFIGMSILVWSVGN